MLRMARVCGTTTSRAKSEKVGWARAFAQQARGGGLDSGRMDVRQAPLPDSHAVPPPSGSSARLAGCASSCWRQVMLDDAGSPNHCSGQDCTSGEGRHCSTAPIPATPPFRASRVYAAPHTARDPHHSRQPRGPHSPPQRPLSGPSCTPLPPVHWPSTQTLEREEAQGLLPPPGPPAGTPALPGTRARGALTAASNHSAQAPNNERRLSASGALSPGVVHLRVPNSQPNTPSQLTRGGWARSCCCCSRCSSRP